MSVERFDISIAVDTDSVEFMKNLIVSVMRAFRYNEDRKDIIDKFCRFCGSNEFECNCNRDC